MKRAGGLFMLVVSFTALVGLSAADAQQYPPPTPTPTRTPVPTPPSPRPTPPSPRPTPPRTPGPPARTATPAPATCLVVRGEDDDSFRTGTADHRSRLEIEGAQGCAEPFGDVTVTVRSNPVRFPTFRAFEDGSFQRIFCMPAAIEPGTHDVEVAIEGRGVRHRPLIVEDDSGEPCGPGDGTVVLGTSQGNDGAGGGGSGSGTNGQVSGGGTGNGNGTLPNNGAEILLLVLWALVLIGGGSALVFGGWRYRDRFAPAIRRAGRRSSAPLALPAPEIPVIDTSRFVPFRSRTAEPAGPSTPDEPRRWPYS